MLMFLLLSIALTVSLIDLYVNVTNTAWFYCDIHYVNEMLLQLKFTWKRECLEDII